MKRIPNCRMQIRVKAKRTNVVDFVGREALFELGVCITYTGATEDNGIWVEGKREHLQKVLDTMNLTVITPIHETPRSKMREEGVAA